MLSASVRKILEDRQAVLARCILAYNNSPDRYRETTRAHMDGYLQELASLEQELKGGSETRQANPSVFAFDKAMTAAETVAYRTAFSDWVRNGPSERNQRDLHEYRANLSGEGTPTGGAYPGSTVGFFVPMSFWAEVVSASKSVGPFWDDDFCTVHMTPTGAPLPIPSDNDVSQVAAILNEAGQFSNQTLTINQNICGTYKFSTGLLVSNETVQDSAIDLDSYLAKRFGRRAQLGLLPYLTTGTGSGQPTGVLTGLTASLTAAGAGANDGLSAANTVGSDDIANLEYALDPAYRVNAKWMMHGNTLNALRRVKDKQGRPVFGSLNRPDPVLLSYPVTINNAMDQLQTSAGSPAVARVPVAFGDFSRFHVRVVHPILLRLTQRYADYQQTMYALHYRTDSVLINPATSVPPVVTLQTVY